MKSLHRIFLSLLMLASLVGCSDSENSIQERIKKNISKKDSIEKVSHFDINNNIVFYKNTNGYMFALVNKKGEIKETDGLIKVQ